MLALSHRQHVAAIGGELPAEKEVHEVDLEEHVDEVEELAGEEAESVEVVAVPVLGEVVEEDLLPLLLGGLVYYWHIETCIFGLGTSLVSSSKSMRNEEAPATSILSLPPSKIFQIYLKHASSAY